MMDFDTSIKMCMLIETTTKAIYIGAFYTNIDIFIKF